MLVDLHAKSSATAGVRADVSAVLRRASEAGIDAVAFCETLSTASCQKTLAVAKTAGVHAFIGVEIPTDKGILIGFAPTIDEFYLQEEWRQLTEFATPPANEVIQLFDERGGAVIASRPYDLSIPYNMGDLIFTLDNIHAIEVFNTRCEQVQCDFALEAARFMGVPTCGGSDPRDSEEPVGRYATFFDEELNTQQEFVTALRGGEYWAVQFGHTPKPKRTESSRDDSGRSDRNGRDRGDRGGGGGGGGGRGRGRSGGGGGGGGRSGGRGRGGSGGGRGRN